MTKKESIYIYDSLGDFVSWIRKTKQHAKGKKFNASENGSARYAGTESMEQANSLLEHGDETLARMILDQSIGIKAKSSSGYMKAHSIVNHQQGFIPNVGAYLTGHPCNMINIRQTFKPVSKVLTIVYNCGVGCDVPTNSMISAASKVACAISTLEAKGYRVNVYIASRSRICSRGKIKYPEASCIIKIKDAGKPLDPLRIAYPLANPSMLRRHIFAFLERAQYSLVATYGRTYAFDQRTIDGLIGKSVILSASEIIEHSNSMDSIVKSIEEQSQRL